MNKSKSIAIYIGVAFLVVVGAAVGGYFIFNKSSNTVQNEACVLEIKDSHEPTLEITFAPTQSDKELSETQVKELERGVLEIYNDSTGGCSGDYRRWMYGINIIDQTVSKHAVIEEEVESSISHKFDNEYNLVVRLGTMISCDGCVDDEAFASVYPTTFGSIESARQLSDSSETLFNAFPTLSQIRSFAMQAQIGEVTQMNLISSAGHHESYYDERASRTAVGAKGSKGLGRAELVGGKGGKGGKGGEALGRAEFVGAKGGKAENTGLDPRSGTKGSKGIKANFLERSSCSNGKGKGSKGSEGSDCGTTPPRTENRVIPEQTAPPQVYTPQPTNRPTPEPTPRPTPNPTPDPTPQPIDPTPQPIDPTPQPIMVERAAVSPTDEPTRFVYTPQPTNRPTPEPTPRPTPNPTPDPTPQPIDPTPQPTPAVRAAVSPTDEPTRFVYTPQPTNRPTPEPTPRPTPNPTPDPTPNPTPDPTPQPKIPTLAPYPLFQDTRACSDDPCRLEFRNNITASCDPLIEKLVEVDSWCGVRWDPWCVVAYSDCFETSNCDDANVTKIASEGNVNRTRITCPANETTVAIKDVQPISEALVETPTCPENFPGSGASCDGTNLQCFYSYGQSIYVCNCGVDPVVFNCFLRE